MNTISNHGGNRYIIFFPILLSHAYFNVNYVCRKATLHIHSHDYYYQQLLLLLQLLIPNVTVADRHVFPVGFYQSLSIFHVQNQWKTHILYSRWNVFTFYYKYPKILFSWYQFTSMRKNTINIDYSSIQTKLFVIRNPISGHINFRNVVRSPARRSPSHLCPVRMKSNVFTAFIWQEIKSSNQHTLTVTEPRLTMP